MYTFFVVNLIVNDIKTNLILMGSEFFNSGKRRIIINQYPVKVRHEKVRIIRLNRENPKTKLLLAALKTLDAEKTSLS